MNQRERLLAMTLLGLVAVLGIGFLLYEFFIEPLNSSSASIAALNQQISDMHLKISEAKAEKAKLMSWRKFSLPADADLARREYEKYLTDLIRTSGFSTESSVTPKPVDARNTPKASGKKEPIYTILPFTVQAYGDTAAIVKFLEQFYRTDLLHKIKAVSIQRSIPATPQQRSQLELNLTIEALIVNGAEHRKELLPKLDKTAGASTTRLLAEPARKKGEYTAIASKDIFFGNQTTTAAPVAEGPNEWSDTPRFVYLTDITHNGKESQAFLFDRTQGSDNYKRLRVSRGFDKFKIEDNKGDVLVEAYVVRMDDRELIFRVGDKFYLMHVGDSVRDALNHQLKPDEVKARGLAVEGGEKK